MEHIVVAEGESNVRTTDELGENPPSLDRVMKGLDDLSSEAV